MGADFKFIHCADLHLGRRFSGISKTDGDLGRRLADSAFGSFDRIVDLALSEKADLMVISGDVFDEENETVSTRFRFSKSLERLGIPCFIALGNHDFKRSWEESIPYPDNVHVFQPAPERILMDIRGSPVEILGRSFPSKHTSENLAVSLDGSPGVFSVAVVHCSLETASKDSDYAPCGLSDLLNRDVEYWALGHIHKRSEEHRFPHVVYPGNIQGMDPSESGEKGAYVVTVSNGKVARTDFVPTQGILWQDIRADISGKDLNGLISEIGSEARPGSVISLMIRGKGDLDRMLRLDLDSASDAISSSTGCIVSSIVLATSPESDLGDLAGRNDLISGIVAAADRISGLGRDELLDAICSTKPSADIKHIFAGMSDEELRSIVYDAEMLLVERIEEASG